MRDRDRNLISLVKEYTNLHYLAAILSYSYFYFNPDIMHQEINRQLSLSISLITTALEFQGRPRISRSRKSYFFT